MVKQQVVHSVGALVLNPVSGILEEVPELSVDLALSEVARADPRHLLAVGAFPADAFAHAEATPSAEANE